jgi:RNA polymerase sigma factor (sigma-70 family)
MVAVAQAQVLAAEHLTLARNYCYGLVRRNGHWDAFDDLIGVANEALVKAANDFDPEQGKTFKSYAYFIIGHRITDYLRREMRDDGGRGAPRGEWHVQRVDDAYFTGEEGGSTVLSIAGEDELGYLEFEDDLVDRATLRDFELWLGPQMTVHELAIFRAWLTIGRLKATGEAFGVTESRACQIVNKAVALAREYGETVLEAS